MPLALSYPGVYIEEIPSGVRTITGVATSIAAFIGRTVTGPVNDPVTISSFADFERRFGGLDVSYPLSYAVQQFYQNGGGRAIVVRLYKADGGNAANATIKIAGTDASKPLLLTALSPGTAGNALRARVDYNVSADVATKYGLVKEDLFNLTVRQTPSGPEEKLLNLSLKESPRRVDRVLATDSGFVSIADFSTAGFPKAHGDPDPGNTLWNDDKASTKVVEAAFDSAALDEAAFKGELAQKSGLYALEKTDLFNLLCIPPDERDGDVPVPVYQAALNYCVKRRAMLVVDAPTGWKDANDVFANSGQKITDLGLNGTNARNAALFYPRIVAQDPLRGSQTDVFVPCGAVAGVMARTDGQRGVWKAPAGIDAAVNGIVGLETPLTDDENGLLNPLGVNCLRTFPIIGPVVWGSRTMRGADLLADDYKYIPVRRLALFIEESLYRGTQWAVFEPNDEPLWAQIRLNIGAFMHDLFRRGAFQGQTPAAAYFVKCDKDTTIQNDINLGIVNIIVGFAPLKPAEFVVVQIQQMAGQVVA